MRPDTTYEFHVSRAARDRYGFDQILFSLTGNVVFANLAASREFAKRMNQVREADNHPELAVNPGALNAMGLIDEVLHALVELYRKQRDPRAMLDALSWFEARLGPELVGGTLETFADHFPTVAVYRGEKPAAEWLRESTAGVPHRAVALEELMLLWLANLNPAFKPFEELFDDELLAAKTAYSKLTAALRDYFESRPRFGPDNQNLVDMLRAPALASPESLAGQLAYIREKWKDLLGDLIRRLLTALDVLKEEEVAIWLRFHPPGAHFGEPMGMGDSSAGAIPHFSEFEYERFSPDLDWMPSTVLMAKSVYVWLDQLSKFYGRHIHRLDQIPDEELDLLARRGFNSLWLIGVWERSKASQRIKQLTGNPEAVASAYSLADYTVAEDLGGEGACANLRDRAWARGIRLASDMVPNHMGIDSRWVIQHPDWFLSLPYSPFPAYSFNGPDLSNDGRVEIKIDDHYYNRSDAAVTFRRLDRWSGDTRFIYHGNDGTSFPWNDTAQLNYLHPEVREAVIQTILHVARMFPIIRFDAAMTLTKRHYQRLWFPQPGTGGAIPSRAEHGLTKEQFDAAMPQEFWREVVDRVAAEAPGTLLLAEAFWLMEGYFVRTLGMHRVYNSAFMNMLRDEENANYRSVMKNTLEFDPDVLKRYVNFMNNPDERTAVDQFGKGDKYFGVCTMMVTLPGLPMFGHGQIEGFTERYGMEYRRAYYEEKPDTWLVARHERDISPLLHRRPLFAEVRDFLLYDFYTDEGWVNEDVYAYSNRLGDQRALVVYHNRYASTRGWVRISAGYAEKLPGGGKRVGRRTLGESFGLAGDGSMFVAFRDSFTGQEYLHRARDVAERGLHVELHAYQCHVFLDWRDISDRDGRPWGALCDTLAGHGVSSLDDALRQLELQPVHDAVRALLDPALVEEFAEHAAASEPEEAKRRASELVQDACRRARRFVEEARHFASSAGGEAVGLGARQWQGQLDAVVGQLCEDLEAALRMPELEHYFADAWPEEARSVLPTAGAQPKAAFPVWGAVVAWCAVQALGCLSDPKEPEAAAVRLFDSMHLREALADALARLGLKDEERWRAAARVRASFAHAGWAPGAQAAPGRPTVLFSWVHDPDVAWVIGVHEWDSIRYFVKEPYERLLWWMALPALLMLAKKPQPDREQVRAVEKQIESRLRAAEQGGYRVEALFETR
ncbi:MAG TPA: alpha-amylase family glycosyl hydrolase [Terriglobales bacterium]|nr:alpha-amylase family glycosyl hydrolase [Terriglobales bacterium]